MSGRLTLNGIIKIGSKIVIVVLCLLLGAVSASNLYHRKNPEYLPGIGPYKMLVVLSDSMNPVFSAGDLIVVDASARDRYEKNDIVTFWRSKKPPMLLTHRVTGSDEISGHTYYKTRGDANGAEDGTAVRHDEVAGKHFFTIPYGGYMVSLVHTRAGFIIFILIPILLTVGYELKKLIPPKGNRIKADDGELERSSSCSG